jgi:protein-tyrosine phosphatase
MIKILFICHGNICRSTMAQFVMQDLVAKRGLSDHFYIDSAATSTEEIGSGVHYGTVNKLRQEGIPVGDHRAVQMTRADYGKYDYLLGMDHWNLKNMHRILKSDPEGKVALLLDFSHSPRDIADPWYTGNFDATYRDVKEGCEALLEHILQQDRDKLYRA